MWLNTAEVIKLSERHGLSLRSLLKQAGICRTTYYHLAHVPTLVPISLQKLARTLKVPVSKILSFGSIEEEQYRCRIDLLENFMRKNPKANRENIWHALILLEQEPIDRLRGALLRGAGQRGKK